MRGREFDIFCGMMYAEYCDEHKTSNTQIRFAEYTKINYTFLKEEFDKKHGSISTLHSQE
jgi:hypothetical protein